MARIYEAGIWRGYGEERDRWAVCCNATGCWYFPTYYGRRAAERLAARMNRESR